MAFDFLLVLFSVVRNINLPLFSTHSRLADLIVASKKRWHDFILLPYAFELDIWLRWNPTVSVECSLSNILAPGLYYESKRAKSKPIPVLERDLIEVKIH